MSQFRQCMRLPKVVINFQFHLSVYNKNEIGTHFANGHDFVARLVSKFLHVKVYGLIKLVWIQHLVNVLEIINLLEQSNLELNPVI